jgi:small GTP-binding protein
MSLLKIVCLGVQTSSSACGPGSSSLVHRWCTGEFSEERFTRTIGVDFSMRTLEGNKLQIWDTASQERFRVIVSNYIRGANCIACLVDLSVPDGHEALSTMFKNMGVEVATSEKRNVVVIGTKADAAVGDNAAACREFAKTQGIPFVTVSAKTGAGVDEALGEVVRTALERSDPTPLPPATAEEADELKKKEKKKSADGRMGGWSKKG